MGLTIDEPTDTRRTALLSLDFRERRPIADGNYVESSTLPVGRVAEEPHQVAGELLDRLYVSFLNPGEDVIAEVLS